MRAQDCLYSVTDLAARRGRAPGWSARCRRGPGHARPTPRGSTSCCARPRSPTVTLTVTEKGYSAARRTAAWTPARPASPRRPRRDGRRRARDIVTVVGTARRRPRGPVPGRRRPDRRRVLRQHGRQRRRAGARRAGASSQASAWPDRRTRARLDGRPSVGFPATIVDRIVPGHHRRPTGTPPLPRSACATRWPVVGEPYRQWVLEDSFAAPRPPLGARRRAVRRRRRAVPADEAAAAQRLPLGHGLPRGGRGLPTVADVLATGLGRAAGAGARRRGRADPADGRARRRPRTSTTWSTGSATPPCTTCCARSARTDR